MREAIYASFLEQLDSCGGCTGPRNLKKCGFAVVCATVEHSAKKGEITNSEDLHSNLAPDCNSNLVFNSRASIRSGVTTETANIGPCSYEPSNSEY